MTATRLQSFIQQNMTKILLEWDHFAHTRISAAASMSPAELRDHAEAMLRKIVEDVGTQQTAPERDAQSKGLSDATEARPSAASEHGGIRHLSGFDLAQVVSEFRAMRAVVLRLWSADPGATDPAATEEVARFHESIDQALAESIAAYSAKIDESRDTFLAVLGHDLRGPLASLSNCVQLQTGEQPPAARDRVLHIATRSIASMDEMITDLLEYTKTRLGRGMEVRPTAGDLRTLCEETVEEARAAHPKMRFNFVGEEVEARFDGPRMHQVLVNLLNNAVQHGETRSSIDVTLERKADRICLSVHNDGAPIPPEALQVIFNPLVQVAKFETEPHERPSTSLGLGLFIAREIVLGHGGTIEVSSSAEAGTAFAVLLPNKV